MEDACQAMGRYPADKYNVTTEEAGAALNALGDAPLVVARTMLRWVAFAYVTGNGDLHAKNLAVAERPDGTVQAAPAFDLPSSYPYGDTTMAMAVAGKSREDIGRGDLMALASESRLPDRAAAKVLDEVADHVDAWAPSLDDSGFPERVVHKWRHAIDYRRTRLAT